MPKTSGYIIRALLCLLPFSSFGQDTTRYPINAMRGVRIGVDLFSAATPLIHSERIAFEASADMFIKGNFFGVAEAGWLSVDLDRENYHYRSGGPYARVGFNYNLRKSRIPGSNDLIYAGLRYGMSRFSHSCDDITIPANYWGIAASGLEIPQESLSCHWMELVFGLKAEVLTNFYIGIAVRGKFKLVSPKSDYSTPYQIPGYGDGASGFVLGLSYSLEYNIPF